MAEILQFSPPAKTTRKPGYTRNSGTVLFFPGVRYEREIDDATDGDDEPAGSARKAKKNVQ